MHVFQESLAWLVHHLLKKWIWQFIFLFRQNVGFGCNLYFLSRFYTLYQFFVYYEITQILWVEIQDPVSNRLWNGVFVNVTRKMRRFLKCWSEIFNMIIRRNKAGYKAKPVACHWAEAKTFWLKYCKKVLVEQTDRHAEWLMNRVKCTQLILTNLEGAPDTHYVVDRKNAFGF